MGKCLKREHSGGSNNNNNNNNHHHRHIHRPLHNSKGAGTFKKTCYLLSAPSHLPFETNFDTSTPFLKILSLLLSFEPFRAIYHSLDASHLRIPCPSTAFISFRPSHLRLPCPFAAFIFYLCVFCLSISYLLPVFFSRFFVFLNLIFDFTLL